MRKASCKIQPLDYFNRDLIFSVLGLKCDTLRLPHEVDAYLVSLYWTECLSIISTLATSTFRLKMCQCSAWGVVLPVANLYAKDCTCVHRWCWWRGWLRLIQFCFWWKCIFRAALVILSPPILCYVPTWVIYNFLNAALTQILLTIKNEVNKLNCQGFKLSIDVNRSCIAGELRKLWCWEGGWVGYSLLHLTETAPAVSARPPSAGRAWGACFGSGGLGAMLHEKFSDTRGKFHV